MDKIGGVVSVFVRKLLLFALYFQLKASEISKNWKYSSAFELKFHLNHLHLKYLCNLT
jgi:hypothetical protein